MFGSRTRLAAKLGQAGSRAEADVTEAQPTTTRTRYPDGCMEVTWKLRLRVRPDAGTEFDAAVKHPFNWKNPPTVGMAVPVLFDPADPARLVVDLHEDHSRGRPSPDQVAKLGHFLASGAVEAVQQAAAEQQAAEQSGQAVPRTFKLGPDGRFQPVAPAQDQLERLVYLRNHGQISDAEYQEQRRRILGG
ncbi:MAG TPA: SHOCT domain-containing protein [Streptosporangiaceae bacterium]